MQDHGPGEGVYEGQGEGEQGRVNHTYTLHEYTTSVHCTHVHVHCTQAGMFEDKCLN